LTRLPIDFNEKLWGVAIERVTVYADSRLVFRFKDGKNVTDGLNDQKIAYSKYFL